MAQQFTWGSQNDYGKNRYPFIISWEFKQARQGIHVF
jgi:hypothetical protein